jgi:hypothetical protein
MDILTHPNARFLGCREGGYSLSIKKRENAMHDLLVAATFLAMLLLPCLVASVAGTSESNA